MFLGCNLDPNLQQLIVSTGVFKLIPTGLCHVITVYGLIQPMAGRNRVKDWLMLLCLYISSKSLDL